MTHISQPVPTYRRRYGSITCELDYDLSGKEEKFCFLFVSKSSHAQNWEITLPLQCVVSDSSSISCMNILASEINLTLQPCAKRHKRLQWIQPLATTVTMKIHRLSQHRTSLLDIFFYSCYRRTNKLFEIIIMNIMRVYAIYSRFKFIAATINDTAAS